MFMFLDPVLSLECKLTSSSQNWRQATIFVALEFASRHPWTSTSPLLTWRQRGGGGERRRGLLRHSPLPGLGGRLRPPGQPGRPV